MNCRLPILFLTLFSIATSLCAMDFEKFTKLEEQHTTLATKYTGMTAEQITELTNFIDKAVDAKPVAIVEENAQGRPCVHCPKHTQLAGDINKILEEMRKDSKVSADEEVPININRLRFLYFQVKTRDENGNLTCGRFMDNTPNLQPTKFDGQMKLMAEDAFKFEGVSALQLMEPGKEEITYYYRGEGDQRNIIVEATLTKDGGKFKYYYYRPTEKEKNPYNLPGMGYREPFDATLKKPQKKAGEILATEQDKIDDKNKFRLSVDPTLETKMKILPTGLNIAEGEASQNIGGTEGIRVNAKSKLSLKGNVANFNLANEEGYEYVKVDVLTSLNGETTRTITVPYEVRLGAKDDKDAYQVKGNVSDSTTTQALNLSLTDGVTTQFRTELKRDKLTSRNSYAVAKDFSIDKDEMVTVAGGRNEEQNKYISFQHRKAIKDNVTMVLDVRLDENRRASVMYQLKARF